MSTIDETPDLPRDTDGLPGAQPDDGPVGPLYLLRAVLSAVGHH